VWYRGGGCGKSKYNDAGNQPLPPGAIHQIVGGVEARPNEFPWQCSVRTKSTNGHYCGCFIINEWWIGSAAHCVVGETPGGMSIVVGDHTRNAASDVRRTFDVQSIIRHADYRPRTYENDISLIKLATPITFNDEIQPVCAPEPDDLHVYSKCVASGWGTLTSGGSCCPQTLMYTTMNVTTNDYCNTAYPRDTIYPDMICATDNTGSLDRDSCQGDSGGPLVVQNADGTFAVVGIVSWGIGCASGYPGVYSRVAYFTQWILNYIFT